MITIRSHTIHINRLLLVVCGLAILMCTAWNIWYWQMNEAQINATSVHTAEVIAASDAQIAKINEKKAQEKAEQEAAAKSMAEQSTTGTEPGSAVDSKVCNRSNAHADPMGIDVVVNKKHCIQPVTFSPSDLVTVNGATLRTVASTAFSQLYAAAAAAGQPFYVTSSYRSYENQVATYAYWVSVSGQQGADTYSARPGYSEHQTGLAFDVAAGGCVLDCFGSTAQYTWLQEHAADYGFIQRYYAGQESITGYKAEEWHYRYVGTVVAKDMQAKGIKTLEQYWSVTGGDY